jgi:hypothetical protein
MLEVYQSSCRSKKTDRLTKSVGLLCVPRRWFRKLNHLLYFKRTQHTRNCYRAMTMVFIVHIGSPLADPSEALPWRTIASPLFASAPRKHCFDRFRCIQDKTEVLRLWG